MTLLPDAVIIIGDYLRGHPDIEALTSRVGTRTPKATTDPWVRITQLGDRAQSQPLWIAPVTLQFDAYGGSDAAIAEGEASLLARTIRHVLDELPRTQTPGAVISNVTFSGIRPLRDGDFDPPRDRQILTAEITLHPTPTP